MKKNRLRELLDAGKPTIGTHMITTSPQIVEVIGHSGVNRQRKWATSGTKDNGHSGLAPAPPGK